MAKASTQKSLVTTPQTAPRRINSSIVVPVFIVVLFSVLLFGIYLYSQRFA